MSSTSRLPPAAWALVVEVVPIAVSLVFFVALTQFISPDDYGLMAATTALGTMSVPFATMGAGVVMWRGLGAGADRASSWSKAFSVSLVGPVLFIGLWMLLRPVVLPTVEPVTFGLLLFQQLSVFVLTDLAVTYFISIGRLPAAAMSRVVFAVFRLGAVLVFALLASRTLLSLAVVLSTCGLASIAAVLLHIQKTENLSLRPRRTTRAELVEGLPDALGTSANGLLNVSDRPLLARAGFEADGGRYAVGNRLALLGNIPLLALLRTFDQRLAVAGAEGRQAAWELTRKILRQTVPVTAAISLLALALTPLISVVLPANYAESVDVVRLLLLLPVLRSFQYPIGNVLTIAGDRVQRTVITAIALAGNFIANLVFIPDFSWRAAAWTTIGAEVFMTVAFFVVMKKRLGRELAGLSS